MSNNVPQPYEQEESLLGWPFHHSWPMLSKGLLQPTGNLSVWEEKGDVVVEAALPGIDEKNVEVIFENGVLLVRGEKEEKEDKDRKYYQKSNASFVYRLNVPGELDKDAEPEAKLTHGILQIRFKKHHRSSPRKINVQKG